MAPPQIAGIITTTKKTMISHEHQHLLFKDVVFQKTVKISLLFTKNTLIALIFSDEVNIKTAPILRRIIGVKLCPEIHMNHHIYIYD